jgi:RNA polymerase sigma-70 factor (ECF subfamily)
MITAEEIYAEYHQKVSAYVRGKVQDLHQAEDLVSAVFLKVVQGLDGYDPAKASVSTWVYTITRNTVTDYFRTRRAVVALGHTFGGGLRRLDYAEALIFPGLFSA